ncbi:flagellar brake protein [Pseudoxanthomonas sp.]|uniref:flagellar brake protein n=1 Tax=Pseudoxanthomonas sp. TaxID=1871049 RepID=UPI0026229235|nr:flagellar brake protein [Pseudoxanthomonas sp.]WDS36811.1 MAG: flagellar brake protein [Pseudoxanthomonas sp.]
MHEGSATDLPASLAHDPAEADDRYLVRNPRQVRRLLQDLIEQRSTITAHVAGRDQSFPTALLQADEDSDWILLDGSHNEASNRAAAQASHLLCFAQLNHVRLRFRVEEIERIDRDGQVAFRVPLPESLYYVQRREFYRLETPITESPICRLQIPGDPGEAPCELELRVVDISGGGMAIALAADMPQLALRQTYPDCILMLPDQPPIRLSLTVCSQLRQTTPSGADYTRVGLQFGALPRGADASIQRYIFRVDRQRSARKSGVF